MNYYGIWTLFKRETNRFLKVYLQTILSPVVSNLLFLMIFGLSLNRANDAIEGLPYLVFLAPGLIALGYSNNAFQNPSSSLIISKYLGIINNLLTIPLKRGSILFAFIASAIFRGLLVGAVTWLTTIFFVDLLYHSVGMIVLSSLLMTSFFAFIGFIAGVWAKEFDNIAFIQNFVLTPLIFLGGVFYPLNTLPERWQTISNFNPIVYFIDLIRYGFVGVNFYPLWLSITVCSSIIAVCWIISYVIIRRGWRLQN